MDQYGYYNQNHGVKKGCYFLYCASDNGIGLTNPVMDLVYSIQKFAAVSVFMATTEVRAVYWP